MGPKYFTFPIFSIYFVGMSADYDAEGSCRRNTPPNLRYIRDEARAVVTSQT
jgi:hypothetical protein